MKYASFLASLALLAACNHSNDAIPQIVSQKFIHKYGFDVSENEWQERSADGLVVEVLKDGVTVTRSYEGGKLHGPTTYTFPHSNIVEKQMIFDQGTLLKEMQCDLSGMPFREEVYEFDDRTIITLWDEKGVPISIEEYDDELLIDGKYYTTDHILETAVESGFGERIKRERTSQILSRDKIENGLIAQRISYHPNGQIHTVSHYHDYQLHGEQLKFTSSGKPLMKLDWNHGVLDGFKVVYRNGSKIAEIPYNKGLKHGTEFHYDDLGHLTAEIQWQSDKKHGCSQFYTEDTTEHEWFFKGQAVTAQKFEVLETRDRLIADLNP